MDEFTAEAFINHEEPVQSIDLADDGEEQSHSEESKSKLRKAGAKIKGKFNDMVASKNGSRNSIQDRLFTKILEQIIPEEEMDEVLEVQDERSSRYTHRPSFSLPLMTNNFRRFNARIGVVFVLENRLIRLLSWKTPSHTLSLLAVSTFVCLDPYLLAVLPIASALLFILVPEFLNRHPPPPPALSQASSYSLNGPMPTPPHTLKPASEMSKDFFRNLRDLQNSMDDFSVIHDFVMETVMPRLDFSDESISSTIFIVFFVACCVLFIASHLLPWRHLSLAVCWMAISFGHPRVQKFVWATQEEHLKTHGRTAQNWFDRWLVQDIILNAPPETREAEIFELQRRKGGDIGEWEAWLFSPSPYDPLSAQRISENRPSGTRFFEDVAPPPGWDWGDKKWILDLESKEWVVQRMIHGVEVEIEGERWVYDLVPDGLGEKASESQSPSSKEARKRQQEQGNESFTRGEWRRRRWIRSVQWKGLDGEESTSTKGP